MSARNVWPLPAGAVVRDELPNALPLPELPAQLRVDTPLRDEVLHARALEPREMLKRRRPREEIHDVFHIGFESRWSELP